MLLSNLHYILKTTPNRTVFQVKFPLFSHFFILVYSPIFHYNSTMSEETRTCFATTSRGIEHILREELLELGAETAVTSHSGVDFTCGLLRLYEICLRSRTANRVLLQIGAGGYAGEADLYRLSAEFPWEEHMEAGSTFSITASSRDKALSHTSFLGLKIKDGLVDRFREKTGMRPSVGSEKPDITFHVHVEGGEARLYLDASGGSLHQRGYRKQTVEAGLKEHAAAAMLLTSGWAETAEKGEPLVDFMCGAGTIPIEAALIARGIAPGIYRRYFGFYHWKQHRREEWSAVRKAARAKLEELKTGRGTGGGSVIRGFDRDPRAIAAARANARSAGVDGIVEFTRAALHEHPAAEGPPGLVCVNPPYGIRLEESGMVPALYQEIGRQLKRRFNGWRAAVLVPDAEAGRHLGLQADSVSALSNGELHSKLVQLSVTPENAFRVYFPFYGALRGKGNVASHLQDFQNRLVKNKKQLSAYRKKQDISCYRIYDADIPEYAAAVDIYGHSYAYIQEYEPPPEIPKEKARFRLIEMVGGVSEAMDIPKENIYVTQRRRQRGDGQYGKRGATESFVPVREGGLTFLVNFTDYLDTGLFLEHRELRSRIRAEAAGKKFLNLYSYTGTASVYAAAGGATEVVSVDTSGKYLAWGKENLLINNIPLNGYRGIRSDAISWLENCNERFDCIFVDPPSFSNSNERDYQTLIGNAAGLLAAGGVIYFTTHVKGFTPKLDTLAGTVYVDITEIMTPPDFQNGKGTYNCYKIEKRYDRGRPTAFT